MKTLKNQLCHNKETGYLVSKTYLETSRAPIDKLDGPLGLDDTDGSIDIFGDNITTVQHAAEKIKIQYFRKIGNFCFTYFLNLTKTCIFRDGDRISPFG